jgi:hypothetical protein
MEVLAETFAELNVVDTLAEAVQAVGFSKPTALQEHLLPIIQGGADVLLQAHSGSGRSLAYQLPMMQRLLERDPLEGRGPRSLILSPNRDAAMKVGRMIKDLGRDSPLRFGTVVGGRPYPMQHQLLRRPLDILVATPARLMDHIRRGRVPFERLEILVIDRVDEMLDMGLEEDLAFIAGTAPGQRQTVFLAERLSVAVEALSERLQREPQRIEFDAPPAQAAPAAPEVEPEEAVAKPAAKPAGQREGRRRSRSGRDGQSRKPRGQKNAGASPRGEVNGNVAAPSPSATRPKPKAKSNSNNGNGNSNNKQGRAGNNKAGLRGPGRRTGGQGRRQPDVRFPSDYANGPRAPQSKSDAVEQHREVKRHEPGQYLADYGFSSGPSTRKPVTVVYRSKGRKSVRREDEGSDEDGA